MAVYAQAENPLRVSTPLGEDALLLTGFRGHEAISQLFSFQLELLAELNAEVCFDRILGQKIAVEMLLKDGNKRYWHGVIKRFSQARRDSRFVYFRAEMVPQLWLLTKKVRSRIFQHLSVGEILREVFSGLDVAYEIQGAYPRRNYCVQYRESDFNFASRLMEEEGIYYFFTHTDATHQMVLTDAPLQSRMVPGQDYLIYEELFGGVRDEMRVTAWEKSQELRPGEYTLWDHHFELPGNHLEAKAKTLDSIAVGTVTHKLNVGGNDRLEIYDYPGGYAQRFDGVGFNGAAKPEDLRAIFDDRERTVRTRMEQEEAVTLRIDGMSDCGHFTAGHNFMLGSHFDGDGKYLLTRVEHDAEFSGYRSSDQELAFAYENRFACTPAALRYRPQRVTPQPVIAGVQTATVVGPAGEEIFCDKYGRVKVQFHWDREGQRDAASSCWLRVAQVWAGKGWGAFFWPRIGHEVVVVFEEGDPDKPLITGSVYNAENMPWFALPVNKKLGGFKSESEHGAAVKHFNGLVFNDEKGHEHLSIHSERNLSLNSEYDKMIHAGRHKGERVAIANVLTVGKLIPGGGSGGGDFNEGNPFPEPPPTGIVGLNSVFTYGESLQVACPLNTQVAVGNNLQLCINPFGLAAGCSAPLPGLLSAILGGGMGGSTQFTLGTSAQFTLGQSFEISVGPPKVEIHAQAKGHLAVTILCGILGAGAIAFVLAYDLLRHRPDPYDQARDSNSPAALADELPGDKDRAVLALVFQLLSDALLAVIMGLESLIDKTDWFADDIMKRLFKADASCFTLWQAPDVKPEPPEVGNWWTDWGALALGGIGVAAVVAGELALVGEEL